MEGTERTPFTLKTAELNWKGQRETGRSVLFGSRSHGPCSLQGRRRAGNTARKQASKAKTHEQGILGKKSENGTRAERYKSCVHQKAGAVFS